MQLSILISWLLVVSLLTPVASLAQTTAKTSGNSTASKAKKKKKRVSHRRPLSKAEQRRRALQELEAAQAKRIQRAFKASTDLKPMARQLLETRSKAAYAGVEKYAKTHPETESGALAWLLLAYAYSTDTHPDHKKVIEALREAEPHADDLEDYVEYLLASAHIAREEYKEAAEVLEGFAERHADSLLLRDAAVVRANALIKISAHEEAAKLLEPYRTPVSAEVELAIGRAYAGMGETSKALEALRDVYYNMPMSALAVDAGAELKELVKDEKYGSFELRKTRADLLMRGRSYGQAVAEYRKLLDETGNPDVRIGLAYGLYKSGKGREAKSILMQMDASAAEPDSKGRRLYVLAEMARDADDDAAQTVFVTQALADAPSSDWTQEALLSIGNKYMLRRDFAQAVMFYDEIAKRFPGGKGAAAHWKAAWLTYRLNRREDARGRFEAHICLYPESSEVANALYWLARLAEEDGDKGTARAYYTKITERFRNYYYAMLSRERLAELGAGDVVDDAVLARIPKGEEPLSFKDEADAETNVRFQKSQLFSNAALYDFAIRELKAASADPEHRWALIELVKLHQESGNIALALQTLKRAMPGYFTYDLEALPRALVEALFPRPYWDAMAQYASENQLDPYLVASLIRQESEFNPQAISNANAYGLMQLLPEVGKQMAREIKFKHFSAAKLLEPTPNLQLGTRYFSRMIAEHGGRVEYALAAYNAGPHRVADWLNGTEYRDIAEFVESIPFTETREYVQSIMRNMQVYKQVYGRETASAGVN